MKEIINDLINKKELKGLEEFFQDFLKKELKHNKELKKLIDLPIKELKKKKQYKEFLKKSRSEARRIYGMFFDEHYTKKKKYLIEYERSKNPDFLMKILELHKSSKERISFYKEFYDEIFEKVGNVNTILDLGCGFNPFSYHLIKQKTKYYCIEISNDLVNFINEFFKIEKIKGNAFKIDLVKNHEKIKNFEVDLCFALKLFDSLEERKRHITKQIIKEINAKFLVASFPTKSLGGRREIQKNKRVWFEKNFQNFSTIEFENEIVYLCPLENHKKA